MKEHHIKILKVMAEHYGKYDGGCFFPFRSLCEYTGLDRKIVKRSCRYLKKHGFAEFEKGLIDEDGDFRGSGYGATEKGIEVIEKLGANNE